jgi:hypothetical protein
LKQAIAGLTLEEGAEPASVGYDSTIKTVYSLDTTIQALLPTNTDVENGQDSHSVYSTDDGKEVPESHFQTDEAYFGFIPLDLIDIEGARGNSSLSLAPPFDSWANLLGIPPGLGPMDSYFFATEGSVDEEIGRGGYSPVTPHAVEGWTPHPSGQYFSKSKGVGCYGAEAIAVGTCELMAVVYVLENGPQANLTLLVDASYIMFGFNAHPSGIRRQVRRTNRALWLRANSALNQRIE